MKHSVMLAIIAATLLWGSSILHFVAIVNDAGQSVDSQDTIPRHHAESPVLDASSIVQLHWFGASPEDALPQEMQTQLELRGISQTGNAAVAGAFIAEAGKPEAYYRIGDMLPNHNGTLKQIARDHVVIDRDGVAIILRFHEASPANHTTSNSTPLSNASPFFTLPPEPAPPATANVSPAELGKRFVRDPEGLLNSAGLRKVETGAYKGYQFNGQDTQHLFADVTMTKGDIITSVNGHNIGNPSTDRLLIPALLGAKTLQLEVIRAGKKQVVTYPVP